ncbi:MAG: Rrf2 family transcriptional regulator [Gammaproteobacteria bacterium]|nr:Rrf2 family transcriptional regulator [Gammaproteobacteria bacterium]
MRLTRFSDYSLRVLIYLGLREGQLVTIRSISDAYGISRNHLMKVVSLLTRLEYLRAQRGPGGGIRLARDPAAINLAQVIRDTEEDLNMVECFSPDGKCVISPVCRLQFVIHAALDAFMATMESHTLEDLLHPAANLSGLLNMRQDVSAASERALK